MSESDGRRAAARPRQVTVAGVMATTACVLLVITLFDSMATVRSADMREQIADRLSRAPADGLGLDVAGVVDLLRGVVLFSGALAAAGAVLAVFALQRHRGARTGLTVIAGLMLFSATFVSGLLPILVAVAASMMWGREARDWFAGRTPRPATERKPDEPRPDREAVWPTVTPPPPRATISGDDRPGPAGQPFGVAPAATPPQQHHPAPYAPARRPPSRPAAVTAAVWLTWVFSSLVVMVFSLMVLVILVDHDALVEALQRNSSIADRGLSGREILGFLWLTFAVSITWSLGAIALAVLAFRRVEPARIALLVSASLTALVCLLAVPVGWPHAVAAFFCVALLNRPSTKAWFAGRDGDQPPPPPPYAGPPQEPR